MIFRNKYINQTGYIVGKGPSLQYLKETYFESGPIITLNQAIIKVEQLQLKNDIYSMQKDGSSPDPWKLTNDCPSKNCYSCPFGLVYPKKAYLLIHKHESAYCLPDYEERYEFDNEKLGLLITHFSALSAFKILRHFGCNNIKFVSCDSYVNKNIETYVPNIGITNKKEDGYLRQYDILKPYIDCKIEFITPIR
jgi:hypothetical protein